MVKPVKPSKNIFEEDEVSPDIVQRYKDKFQRVHPAEADRYSLEALNWFRLRVSKDLNVKQTQLLQQEIYNKKTGTENNQLIGKMYFFKYAAQTAGDEDDEVFDGFPMVFFFNAVRSKEGKMILYGLNIHYLSPKERMLFFWELLKLKSNKRFRKQTKLKMSWDLIKSVAKTALYEKAVHCYRVDRIQSRLIEIPAYDWGVAVFLRLERWVPVKAEHSRAQSDHRKKINAASKEHQKRMARKI